MEHQTLGRWVVHPIEPATQHIILKIVGFHFTWPVHSCVITLKRTAGFVTIISNFELLLNISFRWNFYYEYYGNMGCQKGSEPFYFFSDHFRSTSFIMMPIINIGFLLVKLLNNEQLGIPKQIWEWKREKIKLLPEVHNLRYRTTLSCSKQLKVM